MSAGLALASGAILAIGEFAPATVFRSPSEAGSGAAETPGSAGPVAPAPKPDEIGQVAKLLSLEAAAPAITHEASEPLTAIAMHAEACLRWLERDTPQLDRARASLDAIIKIAMRAAAPIQRLNDVSWTLELEKAALATTGLITRQSSHGPEETMNRFEAQVEARGMTVFAHIDHAASAAANGLNLRPTELLIFGNAKAGTPLMQSDQTIGIELPLKALVWQDAAGDTWLSYVDPRWLAYRQGLGREIEPTVLTMAAALEAMASAATARV